MVWDGTQTAGLGVKVQPGSYCHWVITPDHVELTCDTRCGQQGVTLGQRVLPLATVVRRLGEEPFQTTQAFCADMCTNPLRTQQPVYGFNDWYYLYGKNTRQTVLRDTRTLVELAPSGNRPFSVIDAGWQLCGDTNGGPWIGNRLMGDLQSLAEEIKKIGARPGIWVRPLLTSERLDDALICGRRDGGAVLDPSVPEALALIHEDVRRITQDWGYELVKHDFSTFDLFGTWGFEMGRSPVSDQTHDFANQGRTNAELTLDLYRTIRDAAGDAVIIGCNTVSHLAAGLVELQRTGDDTSGRQWQRTRKMGVNTLAFRMPQQGTFYAADADCVGLTPAIDWALNKQWLDLLARSGTPLFVSADPEALGPEQREALKAALAAASETMTVAVPLDWMTNAVPARWRVGSDDVSYHWYL